MPICPMCGKQFDTDEVEEYVGEKFGFDVFESIYNDVGQLCDSCCTSVYYADHPDNEETLNIYDAAEIWASSGKDEDQMFGYTEDELEAALNS